MFTWWKKRKQQKEHKRRLEKLKKNPWKRIDSENMSE